MVRSNLYLLLPLSHRFRSSSWFLRGRFKTSIPTFRRKLERPQGDLLRPVQTIAQGPVASQVAIKMLGTNGGGFMNANAAHPYENPTPLSNFVQIFVIFLIPSGLTYTLGRMVKNQRHGWAVWVAMAMLFLAGVLVAWCAEAAGNPRLHALGVMPPGETWKERKSASESSIPPFLPS